MVDRTTTRTSMASMSTSSILHVLVSLSSILLIVVLPSSSSCTAAATATATAAASTASTSSFYRDVLNPVETRASLQQNQVQIQSALLQKAMLRSDFEAKYGVSLDNGVAPVVMNTAPHNNNKHRKLEDSQDADGENDANDDYYMNYNYMYSFAGYSMKFAKCQPVQYFSEYALAAGEHSPMVTDDIVILRLCPTSSCKSSSSSDSSSGSGTSANTYGCQYNFSEYAIELSEYVRIMLRYSAQKRDYMCTYCATCLNGGKDNDDGNARRRRRMEGDEEDGDEQQGAEEEEQQQQAQQANNNNGADDYYRADDDYVVAAADDDAAAVDDYTAAAAADTDDYYKNACSTWSTYCSDYGDLCFLDDEDNNQYYSSYLDYEDYLDYLDCAQVKYNDYAYFVRPRCDGYQGTIKMAVYYDNYCVQYAGNEVSLKNLGLGFRESAFADFYSGKCLDCSESEYPPYDASSTLCNRLHHDSAKCTDSMEYDLFGGAESSQSHQTECSYIEALRFGTYNELGQLSTRNQDGSLVEKVTPSQKVMLSIPIIICVALVIYACYLHHAMTNLLIKSLSHRELLPPSRHAQAAARRNSPQRRGGGNNNNNGRGGTGSGRFSNNSSKNKGEPDWDVDDNNQGEYA